MNIYNINYKFLMNLNSKKILIFLFTILHVYCQNKVKEGDYSDCESSTSSNSISFSNFNITNQEIRVNIITKEKGIIKISDEIYFKFNKNINISNDTLAIVLSICSKLKYEFIYIDLIISKELLKELKKYTYGDIKVKGIIDNDKSNIKERKEKIIINFSGGFDSLSLLSLLPKNSYDLVSVYWKGFEREKEFFKKFSPYTLETNFRGFLEEAKIWEFMGIGSLLYNDMINAKYQAFGTAFEEYDFHGSYNFSIQKSFQSRPFDITGVYDIKLIQGLTEIGTALIVLKDYPLLVSESLISLADNLSLKNYRKKLILTILKKKYNLKNAYLGFDEIIYPKNKIKWGFFVDDFLIFWWIKNIGFEETSKFFSDIPKDILEIVESNSLEFYEKYNINYLNNIPAQYKQTVLENLGRLNIEPYNERDFKELKNVLLYMKKDHARLKNDWDKYFDF